MSFSTEIFVERKQRIADSNRASSTHSINQQQVTFPDDMSEKSSIKNHLFNFQKNVYIHCHQTTNHDVDTILRDFQTSKYAPQGYIKYQFYKGLVHRTETLKQVYETFSEHYYANFKIDLLEPHSFLLTNFNFEDTDVSRNFSKCCQLFHLWLRQHQKGPTFLFVNYSAQDHLRKLDFNIELLHSDLHIQEKEDPKNRILIYLSEEQVILNIRYIEAKFFGGKEFDDILRKSQRDVKFLTALHQHVLIANNISIINMIVIMYSSATRQHADVCSNCRDTVIHLRKTQLADPSQLHMQMLSILGNSKVRPALTLHKKQASPVTAFNNIACNFWGCLSLEDVHIPAISDHAHSTLSRICLNKEQWDLIHSVQPFILLQGSYGSGKSICAQVKLKLFVRDAGVGDYVYYIYYSNESLQCELIKSAISEMGQNMSCGCGVVVMNREEYREEFMFWLENPLTLSELMKDISLRHEDSVGTVKLIIDEYDGFTMTEREAGEIRQCLKMGKISHFLLVRATMESSRNLLTSKLLNLKSDREGYDGYKFQKLTQDDLMKSVTFNDVRRNSTDIIKLARATKTILEKSRTLFHEPSAKKKLSSQCDDELDNDDSLVSVVDEKAKKSPLFGRTKTPKNPTMGVAVSQKSLNRPRSSSSGSDATTMDHFFKQSGSEHTKKGTSIETQFTYAGEWRDGHGIGSSTPIVVHPFDSDVISYDNVNEPDVGHRLRIVLQVGCFCSKKLKFNPNLLLTKIASCLILFTYQ